MTENNPIQLINCDWLQFHGYHLGFCADALSASTNYKVKYLGHGTRVFRDVYEIWEKSSITKSHRDEKFATIAMNPHSAMLQQNMYLCKIENKPLYQPMLYTRVCSMITALNIVYVGISRVDICCDLQAFSCCYENDKDGNPLPLTPLRLLKYYRKNRLVKYGSRSYSQWLTAPYTAGTLDGIVDADLLSGEHVTHCVSWGGANSDVHVKMYNKTKEIKEESNKRYITRYWSANGMDITKDVWRVEFSISRRSKYLFDNSQADIVPVNLELVTKQAFLQEVYSAMAYKHFRFKMLEVGKSARTAKCLHLFCVEHCEVFHTSAPEAKPIAGRTAKVCANYLQKLAQSTDFDMLLPNKPYSKEVLEVAHETLMHLHEGLKALDLPRTGKERPSLKQLYEEVEWLANWNIIPDTVQGISVSELQWMHEESARFALMEECDLRRREAEAHMMYLSLNEI